MHEPITYTLTDAEAAAVQAVQMARQAAVARRAPALIALSVAVPVVALGLLFAAERFLYDGSMPGDLFFGVVAGFFGGMFTLALAYKVSLVVSMRRMRQAVRQVFTPRTVRLSDDGVELATPDTRTLYAWSAIDHVEESGGLILLWAGHLLALAVPVRAFAEAAQAQAFLAECRSRVTGRAPDEDA